MTGLKSIVVGIDFSECSRVALGHAQRIASWSNAALHAVHVVDTYVDASGGESQITGLQQEIRAGLVDDARNRWKAFARAVPDAGLLPLDIGIGSRLGGIREQLAAHEADLLVLGAVGATRPHVGLGTLASGCIRAVSTDVLLVRDDHRAPFRSVVVGIDFSANCRPALEAAAMVAHHDGAILHAVHVAPDNLETYAHLRHELGPRLRAFVMAITGRYPGLDARSEVYPYSGYRSGILEFAALVNADIVAVGTKGHSALRDVVLGSTAEKVLRDSTVAVWAAKPRDV